MHRRDFQALSRIRLQEAEALRDAGHWSGSYYLAGYAAECGLKAAVARQVRAGEFPDKNFADKVYTHNLRSLVRLANLESALLGALSDARFDANWALVVQWTEQSRYQVRSELEAIDMLSALSGRYGVLPWIRRHW